MEKKYYLIAGALLAAVVVSVYFLSEMSHKVEEFHELQLQFPEEAGERITFHRQNIRHFEFNLLTEEEVEQVKQIAQSDEVVSAVLHVLGDPEGEIFKGPVGSIAILRYSSEDQWNMQVVVDLDTERVESVTLNRGVIPLVLDPKKLMQIVEKEVHLEEFGTPVLKKVTQAGEDAEIVFLTDEGVVTVKLNMEEGKVRGLARESLKPFIWWPLILLVFVIVAGVAIVLAARKKRAEAGRTEEADKAEEAGEIEEPDESEP